VEARQAKGAWRHGTYDTANVLRNSAKGKENLEGGMTLARVRQRWRRHGA